MKLPGASPKNKKNPSRKKFFVFQAMEISESKIKEFLFFSQKKAFLIFPEMEPCIFQLKVKK